MLDRVATPGYARPSIGMGDIVDRRKIVVLGCALFAGFINPGFAADGQDIKYCKALALGVCQVISTGFSPTSTTTGIAELTYCRTRFCISGTFLRRPETITNCR